MTPLIRFLIPMIMAVMIVIGTPALGHVGSDGGRGKGQGPPRTSGRPVVGNPPAGSRAITRDRPVVPRRASRPCVRLSIPTLPGPAVRQRCSSLRSSVHRSPWALLRRKSLGLRSGPDPDLFAPLDEGRTRVLDGARIRVIDGDTFVYGGQKIRIRGFDAPELLEPGGFEAMKRLDELLREGQVAIVPDAVDVYGRLVADVYVDQNSVAETMKFEGYAKPKRR